VNDQFDELPEQSRARPLVMGIASHAMIAGQTFRLRALRRAFEHLAAHRERFMTTR
jgi:allantoinase